LPFLKKQSVFRWF